MNADALVLRDTAPPMESREGVDGDPSFDGARKPLDSRPVRRRNPASPPVKRTVRAKPEAARQSEGAAEGTDNGAVKHADQRCRGGMLVNADFTGEKAPKIRLRSDNGPTEGRLLQVEFHRRAGERLRWLREAAGLHQRIIGGVVGLSQFQWAKYESGVRGLDPFIIAIVCARFKVSMDYIYRGELVGCHPELAELLATAHPELRKVPHDMGLDMDTLRASYREAIAPPQSD